MSDTTIIWARLFDGRLWHAQQDTSTTWCGKVLVAPDGRRAEVLEGAPPANGWVCDRCVRALHDLAAAARLAWLQDPRRRPGDQLLGPEPDSPPQGETRAKTIPTDVTEEA